MILKSSQNEWIKKDGKAIKIKDMTTHHLIHAIKKITDGRHPYVKRDHHILADMKAELEWRRSRDKKNEIMAPIDADLVTTGFMYKKEKFVR